MPPLPATYDLAVTVRVGQVMLSAVRSQVEQPSARRVVVRVYLATASITTSKSIAQCAGREHPVRRPNAPPNGASVGAV